MKIILSPAKKMNLTNPIESNLSFSNQTQIVLDKLEKYSKDELQTILKISDNKFAEFLDYLTCFKNNTFYKAVELYSGTAYKALDYRTLKQAASSYLTDHLLILSAFYGVLRPNTLIKPYRLDFNAKLKIEGKSLKSFWKKSFNESIVKGETVLNLASSEFSSLFDRNNYNWYDFDFFQEEDGKIKRNSTLAKKGRGLLLRSLAQNQIEAIEDISKLRVSGISFKMEKYPKN